MNDSRMTSSAERMLGYMLEHRFWVLFWLHLVFFSLAYYGAFLLRFDMSIPDEWRMSFLVTLPWIVIVKLIVFSVTGQLHGWLKIVTFRDLISLAVAFAACLLVLSVTDLIVDSVRIPRSIFILDSVLGLMLVGGLRSGWRLVNEYVRPSVSRDRYRLAVLVGTDEESVLLASQLQSHGRLPLRIIGLVSLLPQKKPNPIGGMAVLGYLSEIPQIAQKHHFDVVLVQAGLLRGNALRALMDQARELKIELQIIPTFEDRMVGKAAVPIREIKIDDLLRREPIQLERNQIESIIRGSVVLVTGAGGSIGSEICRQLSVFHPSTLLLLGRGENRIYSIHQELQRLAPQVQLETIIADIRNQRQINAIFEAYRPHLVFHAAAHKHVPLMEANIREAIENNVLGTQVVADAADAHGVDRLVLISSDKAVKPSSVMGATKRLAEQYIQAISSRAATKFMIVRFGNVLGSAGSVVPLFKEQIRRGGPVTVTDARMTRFFMTIPEASQLVLQAGAIGTGGDLFVLDMGAPIRIIDLARDMIRLAGLPTDSIEIEFTGCRPGEKMHEELAEDEGDLLPTSHPKILSIHVPLVDEAAVRQKIDLLQSQEGAVERLRDLLLETDLSDFYTPLVRPKPAWSAAVL